MRNRMSSNQMAEWIHHDDYNPNQDQLIDEYFDCMIDCNDNYCRKVCTEILKSHKKNEPYKTRRKVGFLLPMSIIIYAEHCDFLEEQNKKLKEEVKFLKQQLDYKSLGNPLTYGEDDDIV